MGILQVYDTGSGFKLIDPEQALSSGSSGAVELDLTTTRNFDITSTGAITWSFTKAPTGRKLNTTFQLVLTNGGDFGQTWPANVTWTSGSVPTLKSSGTNILRFTTTNAGTTWLGTDLTPSSDIAATPGAFLNTGFTLDVSKLTNIKVFMQKSSAISGNPTFQRSNDGGTTWSTLITFPDFQTCMSNYTSSRNLLVDMSFYYSATAWWVSMTAIPPNAQQGTAARTDPKFYVHLNNATFTPTASTIYRVNMNGTVWTASNLIQTTS